MLHASGPLYSGTFNGWKSTIEDLRQIGIPHVVVLSPVPAWKRGLPGQMQSYYITHRELLAQRSQQFVNNLWEPAIAKRFFADQSVEYISAWDVFCNEAGCLTRLDGSNAITASDYQHLTDEASVFLINSIANRIFPTQGQ